MFKRVIALLLCTVICLSCSLISYAETEDLTPEVEDHVFFGHYEQDNDLNNGPEPIEWRVLETKGDKMLLLSEYILDAMPFCEDGSGNRWITSTLRRWLNQSFMDTAFTEEERKAVYLTEVDNSSDQTYNTSGSEATEDYVFLLSYNEAQFVYLRGTNYDNRSKQACTATEFAKPKISLQGDNPSYKGMSIDFMKESFSPWWFRTEAKNWHCAWTGAFCRFADHPFYLIHNYVDIKSYMGVRPAMWVDINQYLDLLPAEKAEVTPAELTVLTCDESITADTVLGDTAWKMWLPEGFVADELTEADIEDNYIGYYLRDDDIIAVQYSDNSSTLAEWQKELSDRGFEIKGLYNLNGSEAVMYRDKDADTVTASVFDGRGKLLEATFYPYSNMSEEADRVISSIQQEASKKRLSGAAGSSKSTSGSEGTNNAGPTAASQEEAYQKMVAAYEAGKYKDSYSYYEQAEGFQDADKYGNLLKARLCYDLKLKDSEVEALENVIVNDIDFADSKDVLVCNSQMAHYYLLGYWRTSNGMHGYEVRPDWYSNTTVPAIPRSGNYYTILDGTYWCYFDGKWDDRVAQYKFTPISKSQMEMYSYQVNQSYTFNKIK